MPSNRFGWSAANRRETASWSAASTFNTKRGATRSAGYISFFWSTDTRTSGGSSDTEATELAVIPTGRPAGSRVVRTVTPVAKRPSSWRNWAGSTPDISSPQQLGQDARREHSARGDEVPGRAHQKIREVRPPRQAPHHAVGERGPAYTDPDEPLEQPLPEEHLPPGAHVRAQRRGRDDGTDPARQRGDEAGGGELRAAQRTVDSLTGERVEEVCRIAHEERSAAPRGGRARPLRERTRGQHVASQPPGIEPPREPGKSLEFGEKACAQVPAPAPAPPPYRGERQHERHRGDAAADRPQAHVATLADVQLAHAVDSRDVRHMRGKRDSARRRRADQAEPARDDRAQSVG